MDSPRGYLLLLLLGIYTQYTTTLGSHENKISAHLVLIRAENLYEDWFGVMKPQENSFCSLLLINKVQDREGNFPCIPLWGTGVFLSQLYIGHVML